MAAASSSSSRLTAQQAFQMLSGWDANDEEAESDDNDYEESY